MRLRPAGVPSENALLAAIVPDADAAGSHVLRLSSLEGNAGEQNDDCLCSAVLQDDKKRAGKCTGPLHIAKIGCLCEQIWQASLMSI